MYFYITHKPNHTHTRYYIAYEKDKMYHFNNEFFTRRKNAKTTTET